MMNRLGPDGAQRTIVPAQPGFEIGVLDTEDSDVVDRWYSVIAWSVEERKGRDDGNWDGHVNVYPITIEGKTRDDLYIIKDPYGRIGLLGNCYCNSMEEYVAFKKDRIFPGGVKTAGE